MIINIEQISVKDHRTIGELLQQAKLNRVNESYGGYGFFDPEFGYFVFPVMDDNKRIVEILAEKYPKSVMGK